MSKSASKKRRRREKKLERQRTEAERSRHTAEDRRTVANSVESTKDSGLGEAKHHQPLRQQQQEGTVRQPNGDLGRHSLFLIKQSGHGSAALEEAADTESRKRSRRQLDFVHAKKNGTASPYTFKKFHDKHSNGNSATNHHQQQQVSSREERARGDPQSLPTSSNSTASESIDDILFSSKGKKHKKAAEEKLKRAKEMMLDEKTTEHAEATSSESKAAAAAAANSYETHPVETAMEGKLSGMSVEEAVRDKSGCRPRANSTDGELNLPRRGLCDEHTVLQAHKWDFGGHMYRSSPKGFENLGNTCFLNSTLQCLAYLPPFCQSIVAMPDRVSNGNGKKMSQGKRITMILRSLFQKVHGSGGQSHGKTITPNAVVRAVPSLGTCGSKNGYKFRPGRQEDAHEFLVHLLDAMHDGELREAGIDQRKSGWRDRLPVPRLDETTFVHRTFGGYLRSQVRCTKCGYCSNTYDPFLDLALEVSKKSTTNVAAAFQEFTRKETLDSENRYKCSGCSKRVCATKQLTVFRPPLSLCVQLKRFTFGGGASAFGFGGFGGFGQGRGNKVTKPVGFPAEMKLPLSDKRSCGYALSGVVIHVGGSSDSGHYTAYVKKAGASGSAQWFHMDDSFVEAVSEKTVLRQKDAYLLFYCRKEVKLEFPSPPRRGSMTAEEATEQGRARARARSSSFSEYDKPGVAVSPVSTKTAEKGKALAQEAATGSGSDSYDKKGVTAAAAGKCSDNNQKGPIAVSTKATKPAGSDDSSSGDSSDKSSGDSEARESKQSGAHEKRAPDPPSSTASKKVTENVDNDKCAAKGEAPTKKKSSTSDASASSSSSDDSDSSSSGSESSSGSSSDSDSGSGTEASSKKPVIAEKRMKPAPLSSGKEKSSTKTSVKAKKGSALTRVVLDRGSGREKVSVIMGPRFKGKKAWNPQTSGTTKQGQDYELLGNRVVDKWDEDTESMHSSEASKVSEARAHIVNTIDKKNRSQKRKMHLGRWDATLDRGRTKKVKEKSTHDVVPVGPGGGAFQRILTGLQKITHKRPKGFVEKGSTGNHSSQKKRKRNH